VATSFKRRNQLWSIFFGIGLAIVANVDGVRIFDAFQARPELAQTIIARQDQFRSAYAQTEKRESQILAQKEALIKAKAALADAITQHGSDSAQATAAREKRDAVDEALAQLTNPQELRTIAEDAQQQVANVVALGVPIGNDYFPHCRLFGGNNLSTTCAGPAWVSGVGSALWAERLRFLGYILLWLVPVTITGMLIGLGAPFWFDVAKRLAEVRQMFNGSGSDATRLSARDANGDPRMREAIVSRVVDDAAGTVFDSKP
jgi:hypothetical protein